MDGPMDAPRLLEAYGDTLLRLCYLYLGDRDQAEDAVQETFLRALRAWPRFRGGEQRGDVAHPHRHQCL